MDQQTESNAQVQLDSVNRQLEQTKSDVQCLRNRVLFLENEAEEAKNNWKTSNRIKFIGIAFSAIVCYTAIVLKYDHPELIGNGTKVFGSLWFAIFFI
jgi:hypothetical protein